MVCRGRTFAVPLIRIYTRALWCAERGLLLPSLTGITQGHFGAEQNENEKAEK